MPRQFLVVHFKSKEKSLMQEVTNVQEVSIKAKVWRPSKPEPPLREIRALQIESEGKPASYLLLDEIEDWALLTTETHFEAK
jgi:hypothetical protein